MMPAIYWENKNKPQIRIKCVLLLLFLQAFSNQTIFQNFYFYILLSQEGVEPLPSIFLHPKFFWGNNFFFKFLDNWMRIFVNCQFVKWQFVKRQLVKWQFDKQNFSKYFYNIPLCSAVSIIKFLNFLNISSNCYF